MITILALRPFRTLHDISTPAFKTDVDHFPQRNRIEKPINKYNNGIDSFDNVSNISTKSRQQPREIRQVCNKFACCSRDEA